VAEHVLVRTTDGVAVVTLNDPERRNPLSPALVSTLLRELEDLASNSSCRAVVLTGAGRGFCAGADLGRMAASTVAEDREEYGTIITLNKTLWGYPKPTVAAVHGFALGGGCSLMCWCDFAIVEEGTQMGFPELLAGLPATTVIPTLLRLVGRRTMLELVLLGQSIDTARAVEIGLASQAVPTGEAVKTAMEMARALAANDPTAMRMTKEIVRTVEDAAYDESITYAKEIRVLARAMLKLSAEGDGAGQRAWRA
jgi:methylglutaconyl-CoA hydratase